MRDVDPPCPYDGVVVAKKKKEEEQEEEERTPIRISLFPN